ncbi:MAG: TetR/AcrR family transcriptional regulator [Candidatus Binataceae bacterium]
MDASSLRSNVKPRLKQDEKSAETRRRLLDAAILCLIERGYANTTGSEIAERAGLSRGAQLYHFPTKEELLTKAVEHLFELMFGEMRERVEQNSGQADRQSVAIDLIWEMANGPLYQAWLELMIASRTDAYLRDSIRGVNTRLTEFVQKTFRGIFTPATCGIPNFDLVPVMIVLMMEGLAIGTDARDKQVVERVLEALKSLCAFLFVPAAAQ